MSSWSVLSARVNATQLRAFGESVIIANAGSSFVQFTALRLQRQPLENESSGAFERIWTTTVALPTTPAAGATVQLGTVEYLVHNVKSDEDPDSNGFTIYLNRKRPL